MRPSVLKMIIVICFVFIICPVAAVLYGAVLGFFDPIISDCSGFVEIM